MFNSRTEATPDQPYSWSRPVKQRITRVMQQRCPICEGRKTVYIGFYNGGTGRLPGRQPCLQCGGTGMVTYTETVEVLPDAP